MKIIIIKLLLLFILISPAYGQKVYINIRFIHGGEELKPVGTLLVNMIDTIRPKDRESDKFFGRTIKTDIQSFNALDSFIEKSQYLNKDNSQLKGSNEYYVIKYSNGLRFFLNGKDIHAFFSMLKVFLRKEHANPVLTEAFEDY